MSKRNAGGGKFALKPGEAPNDQVPLPRGDGGGANAGFNKFRNMAMNDRGGDFVVRKRGGDFGAPPQIDIFSEVKQNAAHEASIRRPAWETTAAPKMAPLTTKIHFGQVASVNAAAGEGAKTAMQLALERKKAKKELAEQIQRQAAEREANKYAGLPEWKKAMFVKKDAEAKKKSAGADAVAARREAVEHMFDDLPPFLREGKVKKEKRRILQEEGVLL
jgi:hypothetical protein